MLYFEDKANFFDDRERRVVNYISLLFSLIFTNKKTSLDPPINFEVKLMIF